MAQRSTITRDLRSPKYRPRVVGDKRKQRNKRQCRKPEATKEQP